MIPILFAENSTTWTTNGIGRLSDAISCKVTEERNGKYELEMVYPTTGIHFADIGIRKIILVKPCAKNTLQPFRIYQISRPIHGKVTINAQHLSYDLTKYVALPFSVTASGTACATVLNNLKSRSVTTCPFDFQTNVTTVASYSQKIPSSIRQRLGGIEGSVLDQFGGEYEWDGYTVKLLSQRGTATNYTLRYGKNITDVKQEENIANTVTGVVPYWQNIAGDTVVYGDPVYSSHRSEYSTDLIIPLDLSDEWDSAPTTSQLQTAAQIYVNSSGFGIPKVSIKVSFVNLADTEEYKDILPLQNLNLCDTVKVQFEELGIDTTAKVVETVYDVLSEKYDSVQIGSLKTTLASVMTDYEASMAQAIEETGERTYSQIGNEVNELVDNATAWLTSSGGYVMAVKNNDGSWKELLFMDTNDVQTAHNVLRINENGIGFSSTGVSGPYTQAWTLDGKLVIGGTNTPSITAYDNQRNIIFQASATAMIWNAQNSSMDANGIITMNGANINNGSIFQVSNSSDNFFQPWILIEDGVIRGGHWTQQSGASEPVFIETGRLAFDSIANHRDLTIHSDGAIRISGDDNTSIVSDDLIELECDRLQIRTSNVLAQGYSGNYVSNILYESLENWLNANLNITKVGDYVTDISFVDYADTQFATYDNKRQFVNGIAT